MRCQHKAPIDKMEWDGGRLVCARGNGIYCQADRSINGSLELRWAREVSRERQELVPEPKLINPVDVAQQIEHVSASAGIYG